MVSSSSSSRSSKAQCSGAEQLRSLLDSTSMRTFAAARTPWPCCSTSAPTSSLGGLEPSSAPRALTSACNYQPKVVGRQHWHNSLAAAAVSHAHEVESLMWSDRRTHLQSRQCCSICLCCNRSIYCCLRRRCECDQCGKVIDRRTYLQMQHLQLPATKLPGLQ
jgi:hypothetical protein